MAKITLADGYTFEGTPEEIFEMSKLVAKEEEDTAEPVEDHTLRVGDVAKVTEVGTHAFDEGELVRIRIVEVESRPGQPYFAERLDGTFESRGWLHPYEVEKATDEEIAEAEEEMTSVPTYEVGDIARVVESPCALPTGTIFEVAEVDESGNVYDDSDVGYVYLIPDRQLELVAKASNREDV